MTSPEAATMIIPQGTEIAVDGHGQLSIRTPGNLVLQNSGAFGTLESVHGSIRIERGVEIEAATVRCAEACYVQGSLTAWKVIARTLHLEDTAQAHIVLQETESLDVGRGARLVGNFANEDELFVLFSRFADQVRSLPIYSSRRRRPVPAGDDAELMRAIADPGEARPEPAKPVEEAPQGLPEPLLFAQALLARELEQGELDRTSRRVLQELAKLLDEGDLETLRSTHRALFAKIIDPGDHLKKAEWLVADHFEGD
ncbi:MAG TPA: hypothetical protein VLF66_03975 [Thermoanaerobaculia bacterium]|nr:hypothetical protein [Thermoanaerobaculia bacterium]